MAREGTALKDLMPDDVRGYLLDHPDFLEDNGDLLAALLPPEQNRGEKVEDFQRYMLARLQDDYLAIKGEHDDLLELMQEHMQRQNRINAAVLSLIETKSFEDTIAFVCDEMAQILDQEAVSLFIESGGALEEGSIGALRIMPQGFIDRWLPNADIDLCEQVEAEPDLFGEENKTIRSRALVRLYLGEALPEGLLVLGHRDPMYYATGLATEQIEMLGAVLEHGVSKWLKPAS